MVVVTPIVVVNSNILPKQPHSTHVQSQEPDYYFAMVEATIKEKM